MIGSNNNGNNNDDDNGDDEKPSTALQAAFEALRSDQDRTLNSPENLRLHAINLILVGFETWHLAETKAIKAKRERVLN